MCNPNKTRFFGELEKKPSMYLLFQNVDKRYTGLSEAYQNLGDPNQQQTCRKTKFLALIDNHLRLEKLSQDKGKVLIALKDFVRDPQKSKWAHVCKIAYENPSFNVGLNSAVKDLVYKARILYQEVSAPQTLLSLAKLAPDEQEVDDIMLSQCLSDNYRESISEFISGRISYTDVSLPETISLNLDNFLVDKRESFGRSRMATPEIDNLAVNIYAHLRQSPTLSEDKARILLALINFIELHSFTLEDLYITLFNHPRYHQAYIHHSKVAHFVECVLDHANEIISAKNKAYEDANMFLSLSLKN